MPDESKLRNAAKDVADKTRSAAKETAGHLKDQAQAQAAEAKDNVAGEVHSVASALRTASDELREGSPQERAMGQIAGTLADVSDVIRDKDLGDMVTSASDFARRNPIAFLGGAAFLGFAATRFAKASGESRESDPAYGHTKAAQDTARPHASPASSAQSREEQTA